MSSSSVVVLKRTEVTPAFDWYVDLDEYLEPQYEVQGAVSYTHLTLPTICSV